jgi:hypothetical protein
MQRTVQATKQIDFSTVAEQLPSPTTRARMARITPEQLLTVTDAAACVGCCEETIRRALRFGTKRVRIRSAALFAWLDSGGKTTAA